jgi:hypothetical protein
MSRLAPLLSLGLLSLGLTACSDYDLKRGTDAAGDTSPPAEEEAEPEPDPEHPDIRVSPDSLDFSYVPLNCESSPQTVTVSNVGAADLEVSELELSGDDGSRFQLEDAESDFTLAPGEERAFEVIFTPGSTSTQVGDLVVHSNDPDSPEVGVALEGLGAEGGTYEELFTQEAFDAVDILWVVDNSGSMSDALSHVKENFTLFVGPFLEIGLDFHMGVITTDMDQPSHSGRLQGSVTYITADTPDAEAVFLSAIDVGSSGSGNEQGLAAIQAALSEPLISDHNAGFLREEANLVTIVVTDEDDGSDVSAASFLSWYWGLKASPTMVSFSAFCGDDNGGLFGCSEWVSWSEGLITAEPGTKYIDVLEQVGGVWASICSDDFSDALSLLSIEASGLKDTFVLSAVPTSVGAMEVLVNGSESPYSDVDGWTFDWDRNAVVFHGAAVPPNNATIEISYPYEEGC